MISTAFNNLSLSMTPGTFVFLVLITMATSPILFLAMGYIAYRWATSPFRKDEEDESNPYGDASLYNRNGGR